MGGGRHKRQRTNRPQSDPEEEDSASLEADSPDREPAEGTGTGVVADTVNSIAKKAICT